jgi:hypothetical protein
MFSYEQKKFFRKYLSLKTLIRVKHGSAYTDKILSMLPKTIIL